MKKINFKKYTKIVLIIVLIIILYLFGVLSPIERVFTKVINPVSGFFYSLSSKLRLTYNEQTSKIDLWETIRGLEERNSVLVEENARLKSAEDENKILRGYLNFFDEKKYKHVMANVISHGNISDLNNRTEVIVIDKGKTDGLYPGLIILNSGGVVVGKIFEVKEGISKVYLVNSSKCKIAATILAEDKTSGIAEGELGLTVEMRLIPQDRDIKINDLVITSGLEEAIPRGLAIGYVMEVEKENNELWQTARLSSMIDDNELTTVSVLLP